MWSDRGSKRRRRWIAAFAVAWATGATAISAKEIVKVATLAPQGSVWDNALRAMGEAWGRASSGDVVLRVYPGGVAGDEADVVRKMRIGQFQGAALTVTGLAEIEPGFSVFQIPLLVDSWAELDHLLSALRPELERRLEARGYELLFWGHGGWVHLFSREPIETLEDLKRQKLFVWAGDDAQVQRWRRHGYQPVPLAATDVTMGFQTKMIDVVPTTPIAALTLQWYRQTPHMLGLGLAPLVGAVVVQTEALAGLSTPVRERLLAAAAEAESTLAAEVPRQDADAIDQMKARGLHVVELSTQRRAEWRAEAEAFTRETRESAVPPEILAAAKKALSELRAVEDSP